MEYILYILVILFSIKIFWNFSIPIIMILNWSKADWERGKGISLFPVEVLILIISFGCSFFVSGQNFLGLSPYKLLGLGFLLIVISYLFIDLVLRLYKKR